MFPVAVGVVVGVPPLRPQPRFDFIGLTGDDAPPSPSVLGTEIDTPVIILRFFRWFDRFAHLFPMESVAFFVTMSTLRDLKCAEAMLDCDCDIDLANDLDLIGIET